MTYLARAIFLVLGISAALPADRVEASERVKLGYGRLLSNDYFGDGKDRWRTGSWTSSRIWGSGWNGKAPAQFGDLIELRLASEIFAPDNLRRPSATDRRYAGALSIGAHTHFTWQGLETALGGDLVVTGSGTGLGSLQRSFHKLFSMSQPSQATLDDQISGGLHPTLVGEIGRSLTVAPNVHIRPFAEARAGAETLVRAGFDLTFGTVTTADLLVRESVTGQRYRVVTQDAVTGFAFVLGADMAQVSDSVFLPTGDGVNSVQSRDRVRAGIHWQGTRASAFYGLTYLSEEFESQPEGQVLGSLRIKFSF